MGALRKNVFWVFCILVVLGAGAFWAKWIREAADKNREIGTKLDGDLGRLKGIAGKKEDIITDDHIKAAETYKKRLRAEGGELENAFAKRQLKAENIPGVSEQPPVHDRTRFREWLITWQAERCAKAKDAGMICDRSDPVKYGDIPEGAIEEKDIPMRLRRFLISREIHRILASIKVMVPCIKLSKTGEDEEEKAEQERGVQLLRRMEWMTEGEMVARRTGASGGGPGARMPPPRFPSPCKSFLFELEFIAHFSLVPKAIQALEASESFFLVVRRVDIGRVPEKSGPSGYGRPARGGRATARTDEFKNQRYMEAPVRVILECEVLDFDFSIDPDPLASREADR